MQHHNYSLSDLENMLYGLYDGYLYEDLLPTALKAEVDAETEKNIRSLIKAIEMFIDIMIFQERGGHCINYDDWVMSHEKRHGRNN